MLNIIKYSKKQIFKFFDKKCTGTMCHLFAQYKLIKAVCIP